VIAKSRWIAALGAGALCLAAGIVMSVLPGWVLALL